MNTVLQIARRDWTELVRGGRLYWVGGLTLVLSTTALAVGWQQKTVSQAERARAQALDYGDWIAQPERHPHDAAHQGMHVFKPEAPLALIDPGIGPYVGSTLWLRAHRQTEVKFRPAQDATGLMRFGPLSAAWIIQVLGPLVVIVIGFGAISAEREQGTLRQLASLGVSTGQVLRGKALALAATISLLLGPVALLGSVAALVATEPEYYWDVLKRLAWLGVGYGLYLGIFVFLVLAISARARSSRLSLVSLLGLWIAITLVTPRLLADISRLYAPSDSRRQFEQKLDADLGAATRKAWQERFGVGEPFGSEVPLSQWGLGLRIHDRAGYAVMDRHYDALWTSYERQQALQEWAGMVSPTIAIRAFAMTVAGTDFGEHRRFSAAAEAQRRRMQDVLSEDLVEHADGHGEEHFTYRAQRELWSQVPPFQYRPAGAWSAVRGSLRSLAMLCSAWLLSVGLASAAANRWKVQ